MFFPKIIKCKECGRIIKIIYEPRKKKKEERLCNYCKMKNKITK